MTEPYIGEVRAFPYKFVPKGWLACNGQVLAIADQPALASLLGDMYGGNGSTTFALPDYRGVTPVGWGDIRISPPSIGQRGGTEKHTLAQVSSHTHTFSVANTEGNEKEPAGMYIGNSIMPGDVNFYAATKNTWLHPDTIAAAGANSPAGYNNMQPFGVFKYCIATSEVGIYPPRS